MSFLETQSALAQRLNGVSGLPTVYWGGVRNTPVKGTDWVRPTMIPFESTPATLGGAQSNTGIYQVAIFIDLGQGEGPLLTLMDAVKDHFRASVRLTEGSTTVFIRSVSISQPVITEAWLQGNVEIGYEYLEN